MCHLTFLHLSEHVIEALAIVGLLTVAGIGSLICATLIAYKGLDPHDHGEKFPLDNDSNHVVTFIIYLLIVISIFSIGYIVAVNNLGII